MLEDYSADTPVTSEAMTGAGRGTAETLEADSPGDRLDEFPPGYSSVGWSPPEPACASPGEDHDANGRSGQLF